MRIPRAAVAALLAVRDMSDMLPIDYCSPQCPSCKSEFLKFDVATSCVNGSAYITNCGGCQQCIIGYAIQQGLENKTDPMDAVAEVVIQRALNLCANSSASADIQALQSQAMRMSSIGSVLISSSRAVATPTSHAITSAPTPTPTGTEPWSSMTTSGWDEGDWKSVLSTASWAPEFSSYIIAASRAAMTAKTSATPTTTPPPTEGTETTSTVSPGWVAGPVVGSILGLATVIVIIFLTRRRNNRNTIVVEEPVKEETDDDSNHSSSQGKPQLHSDCVPVGELANTEVVRPVELPALEPVGPELNTPMESEKDPVDWPLPLSPLTALFVASELRDERTGGDESPKHETFYHA